MLTMVGQFGLHWIAKRIRGLSADLVEGNGKDVKNGGSMKKATLTPFPAGHVLKIPVTFT